MASILITLSILLAITFAEDYRLPDHIEPKIYQLIFHIDPDKDSFHGSTTIAFQTIKNTSELFLHVNPQYINISSIFNGHEICNLTDINNVTEIAHISCPGNFTENLKNVISIQYEGYYSDDYCGIFKNHYKEHGSIQTVVATQLQPTYARRVFPCFDEPHFKAKFDVTIFHPKLYMATGNQIKNRRVDVSRDMVVETFFNTTPIMSTYLLAFVISKFNILSANGTTVQTRKTKEFTGTALEYGPRLLNAMGKYTNMHYSKMGINKISHIALPNFPTSEAMENWGICTYDEIYILDEGEATTIEHKEMIIKMIAHEISHQWFGNVVTMDWWSNLWLNEGFARYFEYHLPTLLENFDLDFQRQFVVNNIHQTLLVDSFPNDPLSNKFEDIESEDRIEDKFNEISYGKGAAVIRMIKGILGDRNFQKGLQKYLNTNKYQNSNPNLLFESFHSVDHNSSIHPLYVTLHSYIYKNGYPLINVKLMSNRMIRITQEEFYIFKKDDNEQNSWYVPITYTTSNEKDFAVNIQQWLEPDKPLYIDIEEDAWILFNLQQIGYYRVNYDGILWDRLIEVLKGPDMNTIDVLNRASLIDDIFNIARVGKVSYKKVFHLVEFLQNEKEYYPWYAYINNIPLIINQIKDDETMQMLQNLTLKWLNQAFPKSNIEQHDDSITTYKHVQVSTWKCALGDPDCTTYALQHYKEFRKSFRLSNYNERYSILCTGISSSPNPEQEFTFLLQYYQNTDSKFERKDIIRALGCSYNTLKRYWSEIINENTLIFQQDLGMAFETIIENYGMNLILDSLENNSSQITERFYSIYTLPQIIIKLANDINSKEQLKQLKSIIDMNQDAIGDDIGQFAINTVEANIKWGDDHSKEIKTVLKTLYHNSCNRAKVVFEIIIMNVLTLLFVKLL